MARRLMRSRVAVEIRGLSRRASDTVITQTFAAAATSRSPTRTLACGNERGILGRPLLHEPRPLGFRGEIVAEAIAIERGVGPARNVDEITFAEERARIVRNAERGESREVPGVLGRPAPREGIASTGFGAGVRGVPM